MVRPDSSEPRRVLDEPLPSEAMPSKQRIIQQPLLQDSHISMAHGADASASLELERMLDQVLEQVRLATSATAAAIALKSGDEMICRGAAGPNAPDVGVRLDVSSGLSGACVRTREIQYCADTETDPRANAAASRRLQVRSVLVVPLIAGNELLGVFEIFSPHPSAFGNRDLHNLQTLSQVIIENLRELWAAPPSETTDFSSEAPLPREPQVESPVLAPTSAVETNTAITEEPRLSWPTTPPPPQQAQQERVSVVTASGASPSVPAELSPTQLERPIFSATLPAKVAREKRAREWGTSLLTAAVITVAVVLGWTVGRPRWQRATSSQTKPALTAAAPASSDGATAKAADSEPAAPADELMRPGAAGSKAKQDDASGGLVVYQNGKVIFRQTARPWSASQSSAGVRTQPGSDLAERTATVFLSPQIASARLIYRIEPVYPESALQTHIQGQVELEALVGKDGSVQQLKLVSGDPQLAAAAADAIRQWRFRPYQSDGQVVEFSTNVSVDFRLP